METTSALDTIIAAFDIASILTFVGTAGVGVIGVAFAFKGVGLVKRMLGRA